MIIILIEKYVKELKEKNDIRTMKGLVREYDKQIDFSISNSTILESKSNYGFILICLFIGIFGGLIGNISVGIKLIYFSPLIFVSVINLFLFLKLKKNKFKNRKLVYKLVITFFLMGILLFFSGTYGLEWFLFRNWNEIDYIKSIILLISFLIPIVIATVYDSPKRFLKEFVNTNRKYRSVSPALGGVISTLVIIFNITKPYYLVLGLSYVLILWFTWATTYLIFKYKQYDLIEDLREYIESIEEK
jgi:hypothetical protein